ncbi:glycerophosphodiester phosphodiesterase family protein [Vibrio sonorensis]|uniref:glycerophosphodiester phosphodiesterase family protein n=1 Tax=Vibrio sonorensis TaxID=1004316 RepID=UPI0008D9B13D|nr:glycerophosphodiester phosphodiesterase family protein [Vibrio sonorensis]
MKPVVVGHRGVAGHYPENTKSSVLAAIELGLQWIEVDVQPTKDDVLVVCHDHTINRCSNGKGRVDNHTLTELRQFDFGHWFDSQFQGESIMTLEELLVIAEQHNLSINIEVKLDSQDVTKVVQTLKDLLERSSLSKDAILLSSFNQDTMRELHLHCKGYKLGVLCESLTKKAWQLLADIDAFSCNLNARFTTQNDIKALQSAGYQVWCYTVNDPNMLLTLKGIDGVFSDFPERFLDLN